jgi:hypothetical protein
MSLNMSAEQVRAYVAAKWPEAMRSPLAQLAREVTAHDEAQRATGFAKLQATATAASARSLRDEALEYARSCIDACEAAGVEYDADTLGHNVETNFPSLDPDKCDEIAADAIAKATAATPA